MDNLVKGLFIIAAIAFVISFIQMLLRKRKPVHPLGEEWGKLLEAEQAYKETEEGKAEEAREDAKQAYAKQMQEEYGDGEDDDVDDFWYAVGLRTYDYMQTGYAPEEAMKKAKKKEKKFLKEYDKEEQMEALTEALTPKPRSTSGDGSALLGGIIGYAMVDKNASLTDKATGALAGAAVGKFIARDK